MKILQKIIPVKVSGFTLIEVLITVVILSIGLLGMAGIQIQGLRGTTGSTMRSQATILANDIAERIRMNLDGLNIEDDPVNRDYSNVDFGANQLDGDGNPVLSCENPPTLCSATEGNDDIAACTAAQMASFDIFEFACGLGGTGGVQNLLPGGAANISCNTLNCPPGSEVTINISWTETRASNLNKNNDANQEVKTLSMVIIP